MLLRDATGSELGIILSCCLSFQISYILSPFNVQVLPSLDSSQHCLSVHNSSEASAAAGAVAGASKPRPYPPPPPPPKSVTPRRSQSALQKANSRSGSRALLQKSDSSQRVVPKEAKLRKGASRPLLKKSSNLEDGAVYRNAVSAGVSKESSLPTRDSRQASTSSTAATALSSASRTRDYSQFYF